MEKYKCLFENVFTFWKPQSNHSFKQDTIIPLLISDPIDNNQIDWIASTPPDRKCGWTASGVPFISLCQAMSQTPNTGSMRIVQNETFHISLSFPNSFYIDSNLVYPSLFVRYLTQGLMVYRVIRIGTLIPGRDLFTKRLSH